ncbi:helix-turn-helix transcriptional regulator [Ferrimonas aestuarii]|nr:helix-turn-helix transcriptional regulator [Ferrimonas aestuarii]
MGESSWILLKSNAFRFDSAVVGASISESELVKYGFVDYWTSDDSMKGIASLMVVSRLGSHSRAMQSMWLRQGAVNRRCFEVIEGSQVVGGLIMIGAPNCLTSGEKIGRYLNGHGTALNKQNSKTKIIVNLTALGLSTGEISSLLNLTRRGVDYHLDKAKLKLGASNKANLVFKASQCGWI